MEKKFAIFLMLLFSILINNSHAQMRSQKRGIAYGIQNEEDLKTLSKGISWFYNWGKKPNETIISNFDNYVTFIPMAWSGVDTVTMKEFYVAHPNIGYILGFNEPNFKSQANLTPTQAAEKWKLIERIAELYNLKIVSPAVNYAPANGAVSENGIVYTDPVQYLDDFFKACPDCKVDYIAVHCYMNNPAALESYINRFKKYNKPIWLTEFCAYEKNKGLTPEKQMDYMVNAITYLENDPDIYRYSWFTGRNKSGENEFPYNSLLKTGINGMLTELGNIYVNMSSFDNNFYYSVGDTIQAEKFIDAHSVSLRQEDSITGNLYVENFYFGDWAKYQINISESKEYAITLKMFCNNGTILQITDEEGNILESQEMTETADNAKWEYKTMHVFLPSGKQQICLKSMGEGCKIDWFSIDKTNTLVKNHKTFPILYPNPFNNFINIDSSIEIEKFSVYNIVGHCVFMGKSTKQITTHNLPEGMYCIELTFHNGSKEKFKFIK